VRAFLRNGFLLHRVPALWTEFSLRRQVLSALRALLKDEQLVPAIRTEFRLFWDGMLTLGTFESLLGWRSLGIPQQVSEHGRHPKTETHP